MTDERPQKRTPTQRQHRLKGVRLGIDELRGIERAMRPLGHYQIKSEWFDHVKSVEDFSEAGFKQQMPPFQIAAMRLRHDFDVTPTSVTFQFSPSQGVNLLASKHPEAMGIMTEVKGICESRQVKHGRLSTRIAMLILFIAVVFVTLKLIGDGEALPDILSGPAGAILVAALLTVGMLINLAPAETPSIAITVPWDERPTWWYRNKDQLGADVVKLLIAGLIGFVGGWLASLTYSGS